MGAIDWIRQIFDRKKERIDQAVDQAKGFTGEPQNLDIYSYYGMDAIGDYLRVDQDLVARYLDYNEMLIYPEIDAAVTLYAEDATQPNTMTGDTVWVESDDEEVRDDLNHMLKKRLNIEDEIWGIARTLVTYGNAYEEILATEQEGVVGLSFLPPETMRRFEASKGQLIGFIQDPAGQFRVKPNELEDIIKKKTATPAGVVAFEDWQAVHFRLQSKFRQSPYGVSVMEGARWIWKRLLLLEDALMIYRLTRAPSRFAFYVDIGEMPPRQALRYMEQVRQKFRKRKFVNPVTGKMDMRFSPLSQDEDFYVPVRGGRESTKIDVLQGPDFPGSIDDVLYLYKKLLVALKIPPAYLGLDESVSAKNVLAHEDVRFARSVLRIQRELRNGLKKVCTVHLASRNIDPESVDYDVFMTVPSGIYELAQMEIRKARVEFAEMLGDWVSKRWVMREILGFSDDQIDQINDERKAEEAGQSSAPARGPAKRPFGPSPRENLNNMSARLLPGEKIKQHFGRKILQEDVNMGNKDFEGWLKKNLGKVLEGNVKLGKRLGEVRGLCQDMQMKFGKNGQAR